MVMRRDSLPPVVRRDPLPPAMREGSAAAHSLPELDPPFVRPLRAYAFDPSRGRLLGNEMTLMVRYQDLKPGPVILDEYVWNGVAVVDYDGANGTYYAPVNLDDPRVLIRDGLDPSEADPRFHQQMVYAVVTDTVQHFEAVLGRRISWRRGEPDRPEDSIFQLMLYPHAMVSPNAFYSRRAHGILFGYFRADGEDVGTNIPGQTVFTCLSHDIIVHETTHAIVDGLREHFTEPTNPDVIAFHEAFADLVALFRHFTHREVLIDTLIRTEGTLFRFLMNPDAETSPNDGPTKRSARSVEAVPLITPQLRRRNPLIELAQQFGEASGLRRGLRLALDAPPDPRALRRHFEPHDRGSILVAAVFDAFFAIYLRRTAELRRLYRADGADVDLSISLAERLADEATANAELFFTLCVRALDYCPPMDITFGDFLRAMITADFDLHPSDQLGVRPALMEAFRVRGIVPEGVKSFSEGAIAWRRAGKIRAVPEVDFGGPDGLAPDEKKKVSDILKRFFNESKERARHREDFGLSPDEEVDPASFHTVLRNQLDGSPRMDMVIELVQKREAPFNRTKGDLGEFPLWGGATVILSKPPPEAFTKAYYPDRKRPQPEVRYVIAKKLHGEEGEEREARQRVQYQRMGLMEGSDADRFHVDFAMVHGGF